MTDIESLRQAVIDAARNVDKCWESAGMHKDHELLISERALHDAVDALDAAMRPNPWKLLERVACHSTTKGGPLMLDIRAALKWREEHPDE